MSAAAERTGRAVEDLVVDGGEEPMLGAVDRESLVAAVVTRVRTLEARVRLDVVAPVGVNEHQADLVEHVEDGLLFDRFPPFVFGRVVMPDRRREDCVLVCAEQGEERLDRGLLPLCREDVGVRDLARSGDLGPGAVHLADGQRDGQSLAEVLGRGVVDDDHQAVERVDRNDRTVEVVRNGAEVDGGDVGQIDQPTGHRLGSGQGDLHLGHRCHAGLLGVRCCAWCAPFHL